MPRPRGHCFHLLHESVALRIAHVGGILCRCLPRPRACIGTLCDVRRRCIHFARLMPVCIPARSCGASLRSSDTRGRCIQRSRVCRRRKSPRSVERRSIAFGTLLDEGGQVVGVGVALGDSALPHACARILPGKSASASYAYRCRHRRRYPHVPFPSCRAAVGHRQHTSRPWVHRAHRDYHAYHPRCHCPYFVDGMPSPWSSRVCVLPSEAPCPFPSLPSSVLTSAWSALLAGGHRGWRRLRWGGEAGRVPTLSLPLPRDSPLLHAAFAARWHGHPSATW